MTSSSNLNPLARKLAQQCTLNENNISGDTIKIQVVSDLHLEFYGHQLKDVPHDLIIRRAPILALLGDIGLAGTNLLKEFLYQQAERFDTVLFLAGNHEFYHAAQDNYRGVDINEHKKRTVFEQKGWMRRQNGWMRRMCNQRDNLHFLEQDTIEIQGVAILGTTLWSRIPPDTADLAESSMNDYQNSYRDSNNNKLRVADTNDFFTQSNRWWRKKVEWIKKIHPQKPIVVLTHYTPSKSGTSYPMHTGSRLNCCFSTELTPLLQHPIVAWACGHTHYNFDFVTEGGTQLVSNQRGYTGDLVEGYNNEGVILTIPTTLDQNTS